MLSPDRGVLGGLDPTLPFLITEARASDRNFT